MKRTRTVLILLLGACTAIGHGSEKDKYSSYSKVKIFARSQGDLVAIQSQGIDLDHYLGKLGDGIEVVINRDAIEKLESMGMPFAVLVADMDEDYRNRMPEDEASSSLSRRILGWNGITSFRYGSMGGFLTYAEMVRQLDTMRLQFPNLITAKESLGVSEQGRVIWGAEISDNPGVPEPGEAVAYYDALHHAREPEAMATIMYYMYWLLDNYGIDPEATYLVNNRRMYFVPIVNVDGYYYNQTTNPNGGGSWRKNRRNNGGSYGVDLNRNYTYMWGYDNIGSSPTPSSDTYRGPSPGSEPETRAVMNVVQRIIPSMAWSTHSVAGRYLNPYGYKDTVISYEYYAEFASDYSALNNYLYGTVFQMLDYNSNGTTRDFMHHDVGCYTWTPEVGGSGFWPAVSEIVPVAQENLYGCKYLSWVAGAFADYQSFELVDQEYALRGDTLRFNIMVRNKGLTLGANAVDVSVQSLYANATPIVGAASYPVIPPRQAATNATPFSFMIGTSAATLDEAKFVSVVTQEGLEMSRDTFSVIIGYPRPLFREDCESGTGNWTRSGTGILWDTTYVMAYKGTHSIADSRYGNVANSSTNYLTLNNPISLASTVNPRLEFFGRWANENGYDYARIQISTNNGSTWTNLAGRHSRTIGGQPSYSANKGTWAWEYIALTPYIGQSVRLRFNLVSDGSLRGDGFYFDELRIVDYRDSVSTDVEDKNAVAFSFALSQNYPNPFNPNTEVGFQISDYGLVTLKIYDILGREIATLVNEPKQPGVHNVTWDARGVSSGVYYLRLTDGSNSAVRKLVLLR